MPKAVGIDLGTTNSVVAVLEAGDPVVITNSEGARTTPSVVAFPKEGGVLVGEVAKRQAITNPDRTIRSVKRHMGTNWSVDIDGKAYANQEISARTLMKLKRDAEAYLGDTVTQAVITVPAYFDDAQRTATKEAGQIAGLEVLRIINEPTAAALAYGMEKEGADQTIVVFDLGGGSFDVSVLEMGDGVFEVKSTHGDTGLGGDDWDWRIIDWIYQSFKNANGVDLGQDNTTLQRLKEAAEKAKIELSQVQQTQINLPFITATDAGPLHLDESLTRAKFQDITADLLDRCRKPFEQALKDAGLTMGQLDHVIMVGGSTRMPAVQELVHSMTGREPHKAVNPDEVVAMGAAVQAGVLKGDVKDILLLDVTPLSLGIETKGGVMTKLIERNTMVPTRRTEVFTTAEDMQTSVEIHVLQGEREMSSSNKSVGRFQLAGLLPAPRGVPQIEVTFDIDANGIVNVAATDRATSKEQLITITGQSSLAKDQISQMVKDAEQHAEEDRQRKEDAEELNKADTLVYQTEKLLRDHGDKIDGHDNVQIGQAAATLVEAIEVSEIEEVGVATEGLATASEEVAQHPDRGVSVDEASEVEPIARILAGDRGEGPVAGARADGEVEEVGAASSGLVPASKEVAQNLDRGVSLDDASKVDPIARILTADVEEDSTGPVVRAGNESLPLHSQLRSIVAGWIVDRAPDFEPVAAELALGMHPWPDVSLEATVAAELLDELHPRLNSPHPDPREVVADRLLRLAEVLRFAGLGPATTGEYEQASKTLAAAVPVAVFAESPVRSLGLAVLDPMSLDSSLEHHGQGDSGTAVRDLVGEIQDDGLIRALVEAFCRSGSLDLGVNLNVGTAGYSLDRLVLRSTLSGTLQRFDDWLSGADPRVAYLLTNRVFALGAQPTLECIGEDWGLTRERVRQLETKAREAVERVFGATLAGVAAAIEPAKRFVLPTERLQLLARLLSPGSKNSDQVAAALLQQSGPWIHSGGWSHHATLDTALAEARLAARDVADECGLLDESAPARLDGLFASDEDLVLYFRSALGLFELNGFWSTKNTLRSRVAAALLRIGRPATKAEIAEMGGLGVEAKVGATLSGIAGVVRADKERWAYSEWVDDPYDGIVGEINQRIDAHAGSVAVASLLDELPRRFRVSENSVMMYLNTPAFCVADGFVSRAEAGTFQAAPPSKWSDAVRVEGTWGQQVRIEQRHIDGYSLKIRFDIAYANGLRPGCDLRVPINDAVGEASLIWRAHDASGSIDVGRASEAIKALGFEVGDQVLVLPTALGVAIRALVAIDVDAADGDPADHHDPLFDLLSGG